MRSKGDTIAMVRRLLPLVLLTTCLAVCAASSEWNMLGPDGGDARALAYDPQNPDHIFLGTMAGKLFFSRDGGAHWTRLARLGGDDYVLDSVAIDPKDSDRMYVAGWSVNSDNGGLFRSRDGGKTWQSLAGLQGKSVRAMALAASDPKIIVAGAIDGVYRSLDGGESWNQISPPHHAEIKNLQSVAIDPKDPEIIYAGTWHLPWKTTDGGKSWTNVKKGVIDDSDVFSIIIDSHNPWLVWASACSGIYKSENAAELFHKVQGMPFSARRTRVLRMDPNDSNVVYAGTTEGLWKTLDGGKTFKRMTAPSVVVNSVLIDPRKTSRVMLATDRAGVLVSDDGGDSFSASNQGFSHRQVASLLVDRSDSSTLYAGLLNDKEHGGVYISRDAGAHWQQMSAGLEGRDIFSLRQTAENTLVAGTNRGVFAWKANGFRWDAINTVLTEKALYAPGSKTKGRLKAAAAHTVIARSELGTRVNDLAVEGSKWYAATPVGLYVTSNSGQSWHGGPVAGQNDFVSVRVHGNLVAAASHAGVAISLDNGAHWYAGNLPHFVSNIHDLTIGPQDSLWVAAREGVFRSDDNGDNWEHVLSGLPAWHMDSINYDQASGRFYASSIETANLYESNDNGRHWRRFGESGWEVRHATLAPGRLFVVTAYDGVLTQAASVKTTAGVSSAAGGSSEK